MTTPVGCGFLSHIKFLQKSRVNRATFHNSMPLMGERRTNPEKQPSAPVRAVRFQPASGYWSNSARHILGMMSRTDSTQAICCGYYRPHSSKKRPCTISAPIMRSSEVLLHNDWHEMAGRTKTYRLKMPLLHQTHIIQYNKQVIKNIGTISM